ncbi:MAG: sigma-54-dependent Fis family transcriptional regulator [Acidobacteria bacterium]|nr:sigma-54-dependent Fis family transcriptional regulator [Acidobacteriota bacterium]
MNTMNTQILVADDDSEIRHLIDISLKLEGHGVETVDNGEKVLRRLGEKPAPSLVILDLLMPGLGGMETLRRLRRAHEKVPVLVLSCLNSPEVVVEAMQSGASDYLVKPFEDGKLQSYVSRLVAEEASPAARKKLPDQPQFVTLNPQMQKIQQTISQIAHTDVPVLIHGESGVGKEVVARSIHESSDRRDKPFVKINCAALPSDLLESEMFGYERGAFTGAFTSKPGKFEMADTGTIFLDEISEMAPALQAKLLQVLQDSQYSRLGGKSTVSVNVRVLAATNANLGEVLASGSFREDLYYRLNVVNIRVLPLRERMDELSALISYFVEKYGSKYGRPDLTPSPRLMSAMCQYDWPGNIRELENLIRRYLVLDGSDLVAEELEKATHSRFQKKMHRTIAGEEVDSEGSFTERLNDLKKKAETEAIHRALNQTHWNRKEAAKILNVSYKALLYRLKVLNIRSR